MTTLRTRKTIQPSSSSAERSVHLTVPAAWSEMSQRQLRYTLTLMAQGLEGAELRTYLFIRFAGITVHRRDSGGWKCSKGGKVFYISRWQAAFCTDKLRYIGSYGGMSVRLDDIQGYHAVDALLHGVPFKDYLMMDAAYYGYHQSHDDKALVSLATLLYRDEGGRSAKAIQPDKAELLGCLLWFAHVKEVLSQWFPHFFRKLTPNTEAAENFDMREAMDAQIRALTDGDITKNATVYAIDCWQALAELDAKAHEAATLKRRTHNS